MNTTAEDQQALADVVRLALPRSTGLACTHPRCCTLKPTRKIDEDLLELEAFLSYVHAFAQFFQRELLQM